MFRRLPVFLAVAAVSIASAPAAVGPVNAKVGLLRKALFRTDAKTGDDTHIEYHFRGRTAEGKECHLTLSAGYSKAAAGDGGNVLYSRIDTFKSNKKSYKQREGLHFFGDEKGTLTISKQGNQLDAAYVDAPDPEFTHDMYGRFIFKGELALENLASAQLRTQGVDKLGPTQDGPYDYQNHCQDLSVGARLNRASYKELERQILIKLGKDPADGNEIGMWNHVGLAWQNQQAILIVDFALDQENNEPGRASFRMSPDGRSFQILRAKSQPWSF
jgi:hypothetical protein